ncbi:MAG: thiamine phosphate synthase [Salibacteraceae bacterium]
MKLILVTSPDKFKSEVDTVIELFEKDLELLHLRKPGFSEKRMTEYLRAIPKKYHNRIVIHSHYKLLGKFKLKGIHLSRKERKVSFSNRMKLAWIRLRHRNITVSTTFHNLISLTEDQRTFSYVFLSPIFDGISKQSHGGGFNADQLKKALRHTTQRVVGMGGINLQRIPYIKETGFYGAALLGSVWSSETPPVKAYLEMHDLYYNGGNATGRMDIKPVKIDLKAI